MQFPTNLTTAWQAARQLSTEDLKVLVKAKETDQQAEAEAEEEGELCVWRTLACFFDVAG